jgi:hypothetical protein
MFPVSPAKMLWPDSSASSDEEMDRLGNIAISRCSPSNPAADVTVLLGELLKDGLPTLIGSQLKSWAGMSNKQRRKAIAGEHLNYEFGWKPLVNDLKKVSRAIQNGDAIWRQYLRDSGKVVRRRYVFPTEETVSTEVIATNTWPWMNPSSTRFDARDSSNTTIPPSQLTGKAYATTTVSRKRWFSGAFTYYVPRDNSAESRAAREVIMAKKLLGLSLTPDTLWSLAPWSWAVDWFSNIGASLENWSNWAIDGQVLLYGYMMEHTVTSRKYTWVGKTGYEPPNVRPSDVELVVETKLRRQATPYGFGLNWGDLTPRQVAIATSLGIQRER